MSRIDAAVSEKAIPEGNTRGAGTDDQPPSMSNGAGFETVLASARDALTAGDYSAAVSIARSYKGQQGAPVDPPQNSVSLPSVEDDALWLQRIFQVRPKMLQALATHEWKPLLTVAALGQLFGEIQTAWLPEGFIGISNLDDAVTLSMVLVHLAFLRDRDWLSRLGVTRGKLIGSPFACAACLSDGEAVRPLDDLPELPHEGCTCVDGCRCYLQADFSTA